MTRNRREQINVERDVTSSHISVVFLFLDVVEKDEPLQSNLSESFGKYQFSLVSRWHLNHPEHTDILHCAGEKIKVAFAFLGRERAYLRL